MGMLRRKVGSLTLMAKLGEGGMSEVWLGLNARTRQQRAVKIVLKRAAKLAASHARFRREIDIVRKLSHPRIVRLYESGELEDCYFYVMDFIDGGSLAQKLAAHRLSLPDSFCILQDVCEAMCHAHSEGVVHRDLKPGNILLDRVGRAFVSDFGIAKALSSDSTNLTRSNEVMGTVAYLAPEQRINAKSVDRRADVFAIGALFYEMLMGFPPLGRFPWPAESQPSFPEQAQRILEKCLALNPDERYRDACELLAAVRQCRRQAADPGNPDPDTAAVDDCRGAAGAAPAGRLEQWLQTLRSGTTNERLAAVKEMTGLATSGEIDEILGNYRGYDEKVRWGLIRLLGNRRLTPALTMIAGDLDVPFLKECALEALGKIGAENSFDTLRSFLETHADIAFLALTPLAQTGRQRAVPLLFGYLDSETSSLRKAAIRALAQTESNEALQSLKQRLPEERDDSTRALIRASMRQLEEVLRQSQTVIQPSSAGKA
jgi:tRNA A-37 threonylcarbamoyl transferase component Bud32